MNGFGNSTLMQQEQKLNTAIPQTISLPTVFATIQNAALVSRTTLGEFSIDSYTQAIEIIPLANARELSGLHFKASIGGNLDDIARFIEKLGSVSPLLRVEGVDFKDGIATVTFTAYFEPAVANVSASDEALPAIGAEEKNALDKVLYLEPPVIGNEGL
jgi:hypothetical protein